MNRIVTCSTQIILTVNVHNVYMFDLCILLNVLFYLEKYNTVILMNDSMIILNHYLTVINCDVLNGANPD